MTRSVEIPEQAVVAALGGYDEVPTYGTAAGRREAMRNALLAALPYLAPAGDGGLREALEKLVEQTLDKDGRRLVPVTVPRRLLADRAAEHDLLLAQVEAGAYEAGWNDAKEDGKL